MSIEAMSWVLNDAPVKDQAAMLVLLGIASHADRYGKSAFPSRTTLSQYARCSLRTVALKLKVLEDAGVIVRGEQELVAHRRADRRPVVWDINYDVQILHPVGSGYEDVQMSTPRQPDNEDDDVQTEVTRGADSGNNDVQMIAHNTSLEPSMNRPLEKSVVVSTPVGDNPARRTWQPSDRALESARSVSPITDINLHILRYVTVKAERKAQPDSAEWLRWFIEDEKKARAEERENQASKYRQRKWFEVAE